MPIFLLGIIRPMGIIYDVRWNFFKILLLPLLLINLSSFTKGAEKINGANILSIVPSARISALGGSAVAGEMEAERQNLTLSYVYWPKNLNYAGFFYFYPSSGWPGQRIIGISSRYLNLNNFVNKTDRYLQAGLSYAQNLGNWKVRKILAGINLNFFQQRFAREQKNFYTVDLGILYKTPVENLNMGIGFQNVGQKLDFLGEENNLPFLTKIGTAYTVKMKKNSSLNFLLDLNFPHHYNSYINVGSELNLTSYLAFRWGYQSKRGTKIEPGIKTRLRYGLGLNKWGIKIDYAFAPKELLQENGHSLGIGISFGAPRKDKAALNKEEKIALYLQRGDQYRREGDLMVAAGEYKNVLGLDPENKAAKEGLGEIVKAFYMRGKDAFESERYDESLIQWERILQVFPEHKGAKIFLELTKTKIEELREKNQSEELKKEEEQKGIEQRKKETQSYDLWKDIPKLPTNNELKEGQEPDRNRQIISSEQQPEKKEPETQAEPSVPEGETNPFIEKTKRNLAQKYLTIGINFYKNNQFPEAIKEFEKVLQLTPENEAAKDYLEKAKNKLEN